MHSFSCVLIKFRCPMANISIYGHCGSVQNSNSMEFYHCMYNIQPQLLLNIYLVCHTLKKIFLLYSNSWEGSIQTFNADLECSTKQFTFQNITASLKVVYVKQPKKEGTVTKLEHFFACYCFVGYSFPAYTSRKPK